METVSIRNLDILDVEQAILNGQITRAEKGDPRGTKHVVEGRAVDAHAEVGVVGQFTAERYLIVTVYEITE